MNSKHSNKIPYNNSISQSQKQAMLQIKNDMNFFKLPSINNDFSMMSPPPQSLKIAPRKNNNNHLFATPQLLKEKTGFSDQYQKQREQFQQIQAVFKQVKNPQELFDLSSNINVNKRQSQQGLIPTQQSQDQFLRARMNNIRFTNQLLQQQQQQQYQQQYQQLQQQQQQQQQQQNNSIINYFDSNVRDLINEQNQQNKRDKIIEILNQRLLDRLENPKMMLEQEINPTRNRVAKQENVSSYDLEKNLTFEIKSLNKHFQFNKFQDQTIPINISVKTSEAQQKENAKIMEDRPNIDLVCVIDNSSSMNNHKIQNVKYTLLQLLELLNEDDRISLIVFNSYSKLLCNLIRVDSENKEEIKKLIENITTAGGTHIYSGMREAFKVLERRKFRNPVSSVFLLSDGQDNKQADVKIQGYLEKDSCPLKTEPFTIHTFGFGSSHDGPLMNRICDIKDGNFYYVKKIEQVDEFFVDALGGLFSVVAQDVQIEINLNRADPNFQKYFNTLVVSKTYGSRWNCIKQNEIYSININQLFSGISKDFMLEITIPKQEVLSLEDFERNIKLITAQLTAIPVDIEHITTIAKETSLVWTLFKQNETVSVDSEVNDNVEFNYFRVKAAEAIDIAIKFSEKKQFELSQIVLQEMLSRLESSHEKNKEKLQVLKKDILECSQCAQPNIYQTYGKFTMLTNKVSNLKQSSKAVELSDTFQNNIQKYLVMSFKSKKMQ